MDSKTERLEAGCIGRCVFSERRMIRLHKDGICAVDIFKGPTGSSCISVHRLIPSGENEEQHLDLASDEKMAEFGDEMARNREKQSNFYGWATLNVPEASQDGRIVEKSPKDDNLWHADIVLPDKDVNDKKRIRRHATDLAASASWRPRPGGE